MNMQWLPTLTRAAGKQVQSGLPAMLLVASLAFATTANAAGLVHKYVMRGQVLDVQDNTLVLCIGREDGAQVDQVLNVIRHKPAPHRHKVTSPAFVRTAIGTVRITAIVDDHYAQATVVEGDVKVNDSVELLRK